jgi:DNA-binding NtrC family response regulator
MNKQGKILIIDDNEDILFALNALLSPITEKIKVSASPEKIAHYQKTFQPDVILLDMNFNRDAVSGQEGFFYLRQILATDPDAIVILMTAYSETEKIVQAIKAGATNFISKPWDNGRLIATVSSALKLRFSREQAENLKALAQPDAPEIIGNSTAMQEIFHIINRISNTEANILLLGENGTGKDLIAQAIYNRSPRSQQVYVTIDLGTIPDTLFESELFGYAKGAFTDARTDKAGRMEIASGGTLFLNEIGNMTLPMQAKMLTAIERKEISRLGSTQTVPIDVRYISATNINIYETVENGNFRQDLLFRINTLEIHIPPLRERGDDVILLAEHFLKKTAARYHKTITGLTADAKRKLLDYHFPGNVRELQNIIERAVILSSDKTLKAAELIISAREKQRTPENLNLDDLERTTIEKALKRSGGNLTQAANLLGISRYTLYRKLQP